MRLKSLACLYPFLISTLGCWSEKDREPRPLVRSDLHLTVYLVDQCDEYPGPAGFAVIKFKTFWQAHAIVLYFQPNFRAGLDSGGSGSRGGFGHSYFSARSGPDTAAIEIGDSRCSQAACSSGVSM